MQREEIPRRQPGCRVRRDGEREGFDLAVRRAVNSPYPGANVLSSVSPSRWNSRTIRAPATGPNGPSTDWSVARTVTSSNAKPGTFSGRYTSPGDGSAGMIIAAGPSRPAIQEPSVSAIAPSAKLKTSSPKYHTEPSSACA